MEKETKEKGKVGAFFSILLVAIILAIVVVAGVSVKDNIKKGRIVDTVVETLISEEESTGVEVVSTEVERETRDSAYDEVKAKGSSIIKVVVRMYLKDSVREYIVHIEGEEVVSKVLVGEG